jgi:dihydrofolate reductase
MLLSAVVAASENNAIGKDNKLLWHLPNDLKFFKNITWAMPVLMGRKSFESINSKPLKGRFNIIITRQTDFSAEGVAVAKSIDDAIAIAQQHDYKELMILGGGEIYRLALPKTDRIYITRVHARFEDADAFFPAIDESEWELTSNEDFFKDEKHAYDYSFQVWERK